MSWFRPCRAAATLYSFSVPGGGDDAQLLDILGIAASVVTEVARLSGFKLNLGAGKTEGLVVSLDHGEQQMRSLLAGMELLGDDFLYPASRCVEEVS